MQDSSSSSLSRGSNEIKDINNNSSSGAGWDKQEEEDAFTAVDISILEEEVSLQEATLETLTGQLQTLEEAIRKEKLSYEQNMEQLMTLRSRQDKLQQSVIDNTELVKSVENTLRKTLESLKRKMMVLTTTTHTTSQQSESIPVSRAEILTADDNNDDGIMTDSMEFSLDESDDDTEEKNIMKKEELISEGKLDTSTDLGENSTNDSKALLSKEMYPNTLQDKKEEARGIQITATNPVRTRNSNMENRCWTGSLFFKHIFKNHKLLLKILSIQSNESIIASTPLPSENKLHKFIKPQSISQKERHQFILGTCLDPIALLFQWHSSGNRYMLPWEYDKNVICNGNDDDDDGRANSAPQSTNDSTKALSTEEEEEEEEEERAPLDPNVILCPYDLAGLCLDTSCPFQHLTTTTSPSLNNSQELHSNLQPKIYPNINDDVRFVPLPELQLPELLTHDILPSVGNGAAAMSASCRAKRARKRKHEGTHTKDKFHNIKRDDIASDDFLPLPIIISEANVSDDGSSIGESDTDIIHDINTIGDNIVNNTTEIPGSNVPDSLSATMPWWWPATASSLESPNAETSTSQSNSSHENSLFQLDDAIQIMSLQLNTWRQPTADEEHLLQKSLKILAGIVDLFRLCSSAGRITEVSSFLSNFTAVESKSKCFSPALLVCLEHVRCIVEQFLLQPSRSSTVCDIFYIQQKLFFISEWLYAYHSLHQRNNNSIINRSYDETQWIDYLEYLLAETIHDNAEASSTDTRLPYCKLLLHMRSMLDDLLPSSDIEEGDMKWISTLCSCKELGEKFAMLTRRLESPYIIPGFLESLWLCIDERKEPLALSTQHRCVCVMILIFPSIFLGVAALAMEGFKCDTIVSSNKQDHRFSAALRSVDSWITGLICRLLAHIKSKTPFLERQMFEGLLLAPLVALSASVAVELRLHSKAQRRIEHALQQSAHIFGPSTTNGVVFSSLLWSQLCMLRSCFSSLPISADIPDRSVDCLTKGLEHCGVSPSYVSLMGDSSLIRASGGFAGQWDSMLSIANQESTEAYDLSLEPPYFISRDGTLPSSLLLFQDYLRILQAKNCNFQFLPETIGHNLCRLVVLDLSHNNLRRLPNSVCCIITLRHLNISYNSVHSLPMDIGLLRDLEVLNVSHNHIKVLPSSIISCSKLQVIDLHGNQQIQNIPHDLSLRLKNLHTLKL